MEPDKALYSPRQVFWSTFFGGPLTAIHLLAQNFSNLGKADEARRFRLACFAGSAALLLLLVVLPGSLSTAVFIGLAFGSQQVAREQHFGGAKAPPEGTNIQSSWRAFGALVLWLAVWVVIAVIVAVTL